MATWVKPFPSSNPWRPSSFVRLTEAGFVRLTEDGQVRVIENVNTNPWTSPPTPAPSPWT